MPMLEIKWNGSKWYGQSPDSIETLIDVLNTYPLDPTFERYGNFIHEFKPMHWTDNNEKYRGCTVFSGNFHTYSHSFGIYTDESDVMEKLTEAIRANQQTDGYRMARIDVSEAEKAAEERKQKQLERLRYGTF